MRKSADSSVDFVESSLLTLPLTIAALAVCGVAFSLYGRIPAALFSLGLAAVAAGSRLWARRALDEVSASLVPEARCFFPGDTCGLRITLSNRKWLPLIWLTVRLPLGKGGAVMPRHPGEVTEVLEEPFYEKNVSCLLWHQQLSYTGAFRAEHRGVLSLREIRLLSGDGLCLCVRGKNIPLPAPLTLTVFPRLVPVSTRWFHRRSWELETGARGFQDDRTLIRNVRRYQPGDPARALNFRLMARGQGPMVNIYEKFSPRRAAFLLDGASFAGLPPEDFEAALEILASLLVQLSGEEVAVTLLTSAPAGGHAGWESCANSQQLAGVLSLLAGADTASALSAADVETHMPRLSGAFLICGEVRRLDEATCGLLSRHRVPLLAWGVQAHPLLQVLDLNAFRAGGGL